MYLPSPQCDVFVYYQRFGIIPIVLEGVHWTIFKKKKKKLWHKTTMMIDYWVELSGLGGFKLFRSKWDRYDGLISSNSRHSLQITSDSSSSREHPSANSTAETLNSGGTSRRF